MADGKKKRPATGSEKSSPAPEPKPQYATLRLYQTDGDDLVELADKRNTTVAKLYRELFAAEVRKMLIDETKRRLSALEKQPE